MSNWSKSFREAFCERYRCAPERFVPVALRKVLPWRVRFLRPWFSLLYPDYFRLDYELVEMLGGARSWSEVNAALGAFSSNNRLRGGFYRNTLKVRASGRRVSRLVTRVVGDRDGARPGAT
jgi:hypothetical protein